ncbi:hypothetical protein [Polaromonas aquatica]|uniref:hypothetical protein n=1 Tax=Polaromonas aquatica TaxID=332657 RepID=UPI003D65AC47
MTDALLMCSPLVLLHALSVIGIVLACIAAALYDGRLAAHLQQRHPEVWADLSQRKILFASGETQSDAMHQYLWRGEHKKLQDAKLNSMVFTYWVWIAILLCSGVTLMFVQDWISIDTYRACLGLL